MEKPLHTVVETNAFLTTAKRIGLSDDERAAIVNQVASAPQDGDLVQGSGWGSKDSLCRFERLPRDGGLSWR